MELQTGTSSHRSPAAGSSQTDVNVLSATRTMQLPLFSFLFSSHAASLRDGELSHPVRLSGNEQDPAAMNEIITLGNMPAACALLGSTMGCVPVVPVGASNMLPEEINSRD